MINCPLWPFLSLMMCQDISAVYTSAYELLVWFPSGSGNLTNELRAVRELNENRRDPAGAASQKSHCLRSVIFCFISNKCQLLLDQTLFIAINSFTFTPREAPSPRFGSSGVFDFNEAKQLQWAVFNNISDVYTKVGLINSI